jgi:hypothetical protein
MMIMIMIKDAIDDDDDYDNTYTTDILEHISYMQLKQELLFLYYHSMMRLS